MSSHARTELPERQYQWLVHMPPWHDVRAQDVIDTYATIARERDVLLDALERIGDDRDPLVGYAGTGDFARATVRNVAALAAVRVEERP